MRTYVSSLAFMLVVCTLLACHKEDKYDSGVYASAQNLPINCADAVSPLDSNYFFCSFDGRDWCCNPGKDEYIVYLYHSDPVYYPVNGSPGSPVSLGKQLTIVVEPTDTAFFLPTLIINPPPIEFASESISELIDTVLRVGIEFSVAGKFNLIDGQLDFDDYRSKAQISFSFPYYADEDNSLKLFGVNSTEGSHKLKVAHIQKSDHDFYWRYWLKLEFNTAFEFNESDRRVDPYLYDELYHLKNGQLSFAFDVLK